MQQTPQGPLPGGFVSRLAAILAKDSLLLRPEDCWVYGYDNSRRHALPQAVALPTTHSQVVGIVKACNEFRVPLTARGRGTNTVGATVPVQAGLVLSIERMQKIVNFAPEDRYIIAEAGATNASIQAVAASQGFFWPPDPTSAAYCSIGGNLACNAAGPRSLKYGTTRENTLGLRAVTGDGRELRAGVRTSKGVVGYDLTRLLIGSEGTLAVITEATLKLTPLPQAIRTLRAVYKHVADAANAVAAIMAQAAIPRTLEFIDGNAIACIQNYSSCDLPTGAGAMLMIEVDGPLSGLDESAELVAASARNAGLLELRCAASADETAELWRCRQALASALRKLAPQKINEDIVVPVSEIATLINGLECLSAKYGLPVVNFGHAGNGNMHVNILLDPSLPEQREKSGALLDETFALVLALGGTLSGEHGVGLEKKDFIEREVDAVALDLMRAIKRQFDPLGILNPGKIWPSNSD